MRDLQHPDITAAERTGYPHYMQPRVFTTCDWCGSGIQEGDKYYEIHGEILCAECVNECRKEAGA